MGDAAGCPSLVAGEGSVLGLTGAYCLANAINTEQSLEEALAKFEMIVKPLVTKKQDSALDFVSVFGPRSWLQIWLRNIISTLIFIKHVARWAFGSSIAGDHE